MEVDQPVEQNRNKIIAIIGAVVLIAILLLVYVQFFKPVHAHYHAGFQVYVDGALVDFSGSQYMKEAPCVVPGTKIKEDEQMEKAHLHDGVGNVVHSHRTRAKWGDLFKNIQYTFDAQKPIVSFVNGHEVKNILKYPIEAYDSVVILVGSHGELNSYLEKSVTKAQIITVEGKSENCGGT
jgi:hypothetical protein